MLDVTVADRLIDWFAGDPPKWVDKQALPPRAPVALAFVAARAAGYAPRDVGAAFKYSAQTVRTYHRDFASLCGTTNGGLERLALFHLITSNPDLLAELLR